MIITDYNEMSLSELMTIHKSLGKEYTIENGKITRVGDIDESTRK